MSTLHKDHRDVLLSPVVSEKSYGLLDANKYTFLVRPDSNKTEIKIAVEKVFNVKVTSVNTINRKGKTRRTKNGLGKRKDTAPPHNMVYTLIGASLLWVGWFGFNAGSAVSAGMQAGMAMLVTHLATATAGFTWMIVERIMRGKPTVIGIC